MKRWWIPAIVLAVIVVAGCSKDEGPTQPPPQPPQPGNYMPLAVGNWWVYSRVELDTNGNVRPGTERRDSVVVEDTLERKGRTWYLLQHYDEWGNRWILSFVAVEGNKLYLHELLDALSSAVVADFSGQPWVQRASFRWDDAEISGYEGILSGVQTLSGRHVGRESILIRERGQTVQAEKFELVFRIDATLESGGRQIPVQFQQVLIFWFAANIGQVAERFQPAVLTARLPEGQRQTRTEGEFRTLLNYWVQQ